MMVISFFKSEEKLSNKKILEILKTFNIQQQNRRTEENKQEIQQQIGNQQHHYHQQELQLLLRFEFNHQET